MAHPWNETADGLWCECCGNLIASRRQREDEGFVAPEDCRQCGFPDPEEVAHYHFGPEDDGGLCDCCGESWEQCRNNFDCGMLPDGTCMLAGTEECDWDCPNS